MSGEVIAVVRMPSGAVVPIVDDDGNCKTWPTQMHAGTDLADHRMVKAYGAYILHLDDEKLI